MRLVGESHPAPGIRRAAGDSGSACEVGATALFDDVDFLEGRRSPNPFIGLHRELDPLLDRELRSALCYQLKAGGASGADRRQAAPADRRRCKTLTVGLN